MNMQMVGKARARASAEVHPDIESVGLYRQIKRFLGVSYKLVHFEKLFIGRLFEIGYVPQGCYQQMAVVIGKVV
jgi:hypothetical protein